MSANEHAQLGQRGQEGLRERSIWCPATPSASSRPTASGRLTIIESRDRSRRGIKDGSGRSRVTSLANPGCDISNSYVHGITAAEVVSAPRFEELTYVRVESVQSSTVVANNAPLDLRFLESELLQARRFQRSC